MSNDSSNYEVGYGKPPRDHQFKKGVSGNPNGRRRREKTIGDVINQVGREKITMVVNGRQRKVGLFEASLRSTIMTCLKKGSPRDLDKLFALLERYGIKPHEVMAAEAQADADKVMAKIASIVERSGPTPEETKFSEDLEEEEIQLLIDCPVCRPSLSAIWKKASLNPIFSRRKSRLKYQAEAVIKRHNEEVAANKDF